MSGTSVITRSSLLPAMWMGQRTNCSQADRLQKSRASHPCRSVGETDSNHSEWWAFASPTKTKTDHQLTVPELWSRGDSHKVNRRVLDYGKRHKHKKSLSNWNTKHTVFMARILQLALPEIAESFPNIQSLTMGTRSKIPQPLLDATKAKDTELCEKAAIRDFRLSTNQSTNSLQPCMSFFYIVLLNLHDGCAEQ